VAGRPPTSATRAVADVGHKEASQVSVAIVVIAVLVAAFVVLCMLLSINVIGPAEIGLVTKRFSFKKLPEDNPIAFHGEAGYQARLLTAGVRFKLWPIFSVKKFPWVQVPAGEIGVVIAQVGAPLPIGAKSAEYTDVFGNFARLDGFIAGGGQKGVQRPVLPPGTLLPIHPVAFLVVTSRKVYGLPVSPDLSERARATGGILRPESFGLTPEQLQVVVIAPRGPQDMIGIVTTLEGGPPPSGDIASRLGGFADIAALEQQEGAQDSNIIEVLLGSKNDLHNNYQDYQAFLTAGGHIGLQHDPLLYGAYLLNPFLVRVEMVPMLVVNQGEVAVVKAYVGLPTLDTSGAEFKFGSIVRPGHRGIWAEPLRTGKYPINPRVYAAEIVPTSILTLNWAEAVSTAHNLDAHLSPIEAKSREGFVFRIDLQVQIHVPDTRAPKVISMVGTMQNLVNEVLQAAVGNHFRNTLQGLEAVRFIETRAEVQASALQAITTYLAAYDVETRGVYIQDVDFPDELVHVLTKREIANQEKATYAEQQRAEIVRIEMEKARGTADMQADLAKSAVGIDINNNEASAREAQARGEAAFVELTGRAEAAKTEAIGLAEAKATEALGLARAAGFREQTQALGQTATALVAVANAVAEGHITVVPEVLVAGGGGALDGLAATLMRTLGTNGQAPDVKSAPKVVEPPPET
jgi:regulator of protease activity HflC (stomatin/prohibitin superfamily)